jgi:hypothetical protein
LANSLLLRLTHGRKQKALFANKCKEQVGLVTAAATAVEVGTYRTEGLDSVAARTDALGSLGRVSQRMAYEVRAREVRLQQQVHELHLEIDKER